MKDIPKAFLAAIAADAQLRTLLGIGVVAGDPRVYLYYNSTAFVDDQRRAYITYALVGTPAQTGGTEAPTSSFVIWGRGKDLAIVEQVRDRLVTLFGKKGITTGTGRNLYGRKVHENDSFQEQPNFAGKTLHFTFGFLALSAIS